MNLLLYKFANLIAGGTGTGTTTQGGDTDPAWVETIITPIRTIIGNIIAPILILVATVGVIYAIVLGVQYAKAETSDQKDEAKKRIINVVVGALLMIVLMLLLYLFINNAETIIGWVQGFGPQD